MRAPDFIDFSGTMRKALLTGIALGVQLTCAPKMSGTQRTAAEAIPSATLLSLEARDSTLEQLGVWLVGEGRLTNHYHRPGSLEEPTKNIEESWVLRWSGQDGMRRLDAYSTGKSRFVRAAHGPRGGTALQGDPRKPVRSLSYLVCSDWPERKLREFMPERGAYGTILGPIPSLLRRLHPVSVDRAIVRGVECLHIIGSYRNSPKSVAEPSNSDFLWEFYIDDRDTLLSLRTVLYARDAFLLHPEVAPASIELGKRRFELQMEWDVLEMGELGDVSLPVRFRRRSYDLDSDFPPNSCWAEWLFELDSTASAVGVAHRDKTFTITPILGAPWFDLDVGSTVFPRTGRTIYGISRSQLDVYEQACTLGRGEKISPPASSFEDAMQSLEEGLEVNCATLAAHLFQLTQGRDTKIEEIAAALPLGEDGAVSMLAVRNALEDCGLSVAAGSGPLSAFLRTRGPFLAYRPSRDSPIGHFVLYLRGRIDDEWYLIDPPRLPVNVGSLDLSHSEHKVVVLLPSDVWARFSRWRSLIAIGVVAISSMGVLVLGRLVVVRRRRHVFSAASLLLILSFCCPPSCTDSPSADIYDSRSHSLPSKESVPSSQNASWLTPCEGSAQIDLGDLVRGETVGIDIPVINTANQTFQLHKILSSCDCTEATLTPHTIPPGGRGHLSAFITASSPKLNSRIQLFRLGVEGTLERDLAVGVTAASYVDHIILTHSRVELSRANTIVDCTARWASDDVADFKMIPLVTENLPDWLAVDVNQVGSPSLAGDVWCQEYLVRAQVAADLAPEAPTTVYLQPRRGKGIPTFVLEVLWSGSPNASVFKRYLGRMAPGDTKSFSLPEHLAACLEVQPESGAWTAAVVGDSGVGCRLELTLNSGWQERGPVAGIFRLKSLDGELLLTVAAAAMVTNSESGSASDATHR